MPLFDMNRALTHIVFGVYGPLPPIYQVMLDPKPRGVYCAVIITSFEAMTRCFVENSANIFP
jgi:hypothetical protein